MDLELHEYASSFYDNGNNTHDQLKGRNTKHRVSDEMLLLSYYEDMI